MAETYHVVGRSGGGNEGTSGEQKWYTAGKRVFDVVCAVLLLILSAPFCVVIALLIKRDTVGPVLFRQQRVGKDGRTFVIYKFRTMYIETPAYARKPDDADESKITPVGVFLRATALDELPQLFNVLKGEMSLVGPRPEMPFIVQTYTTYQRQRLAVKPGITGPWQLSNMRHLPIHQNLHYDLDYIKNQSFLLDLRILLRTMGFCTRMLKAVWSWSTR